MTLALSPVRYWRPLLLVVMAHVAVLALSWRAPATPEGRGREVLEVEVLAGAGTPEPALTLPQRAAGTPGKAPAGPPRLMPSRPTVAALEPAVSAPASSVVATPALVPASAPVSPLVPVGGGAAPTAPAAPAATAGGEPGEPVLIPPRLGPGAVEPPYPAGSRWDREEGRVTLQLVVRADGRVASTRVLRSSGFPRLDRAARDTAMRWRLQPARRGGEAVEGVLDTTLEFRLEN